ncbi:MAG: hypothetical protein AAFX58_01555 [Pseudomonadota bacterium]
METDSDRLTELLTKIEANQRRALDLAEEHVTLARSEVERARGQVEASIGLQKEALARQRTVTLVAFPGILFCIGAILYLVIRYF